jgi:hypothetical protein
MRDYILKQWKWKTQDYRIQRDLEAKEFIGIQIASDRIWVCVDGQCVLRVKGTREIGVIDSRQDSNEKENGDA